MEFIMAFKKSLLFVGIIVLLGTLTEASSLRKTIGGKYAAVNEKLLNKVVAYLKKDDEIALKKLENASLILKFKPKVKIEIIKKSNDFPNNIKIKFLDNEIELWTTTDAVKKIVLKKDGKESKGDGSEKIDKTDKADKK